MIDDVLGKLVADKYRIESLISESESGDLYLGRHEVMDKPVTLKIMQPALGSDTRRVKQFVEQARAASAVTHPHILNITDFGTDAKGVTYAVFEEAKGLMLSDIIAIATPFDEKRAINISRQIATAVAAAHAKKIIHGGLSPRFVYVNHDESAADDVKVYGFGSDPLNVAGDADPRYLSPEQCTAFPAADERSDVYSLGVIIYEMLSGIVPFNAATAADVLAKQNSEPPPPLSAFRHDLHSEVEPIVLRAIAADPEKRYPTMAAFAGELERLAEAQAAKEEAAAVAAPTRNIWQTAFIVLLGVSLVAAALIYGTSVRKTDPTVQMQAEPGSLPVQPVGPATGAQEENLAKLPAMTDAEIIAAGNTALPPGTLPGGDGINPWANGGNPPPGALQYVPPGGQVVTVDPNGQFMPPLGIDLRCKDMQTGQEVPCPNPSNRTPKPTPTPKTPVGNTAVQPSPLPNATPKQMATPTPKSDKPAVPATKPAKTPGKPSNPE